MKRLSHFALIFIYLIASLGLPPEALAAPANFPEGIKSKGPVSIGTASAPNSKAVLDIVSTTKGALFPRMTTAERDAIASPPTGLIVYNTSTLKLNQYNGTSWVEVGSGGVDSENILANPGFEETPYNLYWTASGGVSAVGTSTNIGLGLQSYTWDSSASSQTLTSDAITIPNAYYGVNGEVSCRIKTPSGTATHKIQAWDGTNVLNETTITTSSSSFPTASVTFVFPSSGTIALRLISVASNEPLIAIDDCYVGPERGVGLYSQISPWESWTPTGSFTTNTTYSGRYRRVGDSLEIQVRMAFAGAPNSTNPTITLPNNWTIDTSKLTSPTQFEQWLGTGTARDTGVASYDLRVVYENTTSVRIIYANVDATAASTTQPIKSNSASDTAPFTIGSGDSMTVTALIPISGWSSQSVYRPDQLSWYVNANISGANPALGTASVSSYTEITDAGLTLTPVAGSAPVGIMCSSTNAAATPSTSATTCSAGSESVGVNFTIPFAGVYEVCGEFGHSMGADAGEDAFPTVQWVETATNAQAILQEGGGRTPFGGRPGASSGTAASINQSVRSCGLFTFSSVGTKGVRLMYEQLVNVTPNSSQILADGAAANGQRDIKITVRPWLGNSSAPQLVNSVVAPDFNGVTRINKITDITSATTLDATMETVRASGAGGSYSITLPDAVTFKGKKFIVRKTDSNNTITMATTSSQTINGSAASVFTMVRSGDEFEFQSTGSNWTAFSRSTVSTNSIVPERIERATIQSSGGSSTIANQSGSWLSSVSHTANGDFTLNIASGIFNIVPVCTCSTLNGAAIAGGAAACQVSGTPSSTAVRIQGWSIAAAPALVGATYYVTCFGPR